MKKQVIIGIPKSFLYYRYNILWTTYLKNLNCKIIYSDDTTKNTIYLGRKYSIDESCLSSKIYLGHIAELQNKCDYILIPRISNYGLKEKVCVKFNAIYDIVHNQFPNQKILDYNIESTSHNYESISLIKLGLKLNKNIIKVIYSYIKARSASNIYNKKIMNEQDKKLKSNKLKILLVSHPYNIYDKYIGSPIITFLENMDIEIIYADRLNKKIASSYAYNLSSTLYWTYSKELIGAIEYYKYAIDGIIFLTAFPCGPDSLVNELVIRKLNDIPTTNIIVDEQTAEAGIQTRLESFIDIINGKKDNNV